MVSLLLYLFSDGKLSKIFTHFATLDASIAIFSSTSQIIEFMIFIAFLDIPTSGCTVKNVRENLDDFGKNTLLQDLVNERRIGGGGSLRFHRRWLVSDATKRRLEEYIVLRKVHDRILPLMIAVFSAKIRMSHIVHCAE